MSPAPAVDEGTSDDWGVLAERCPQLAAAMRRYLAQQAVTLAPRTIEAADGARATLVTPEQPDPAGEGPDALNRQTTGTPNG